jgi:6-phosphogluconate dehydrogenase
MAVMKLGFIGLGKMGTRMAGKLFSEEHELTVWNRSLAPAEELLEECKKPGGGACGRIDIAKTLPDLVENLIKPRVIWMMLPAGGPTESVLETLSGLVGPNDILIDGGNSYYKDTENRFNALKEQKIRFLGIGVSGGIIAEKQGYPLMAGGDKSAYEYIKPILGSLAKPYGGYEYFGTGGAGHFVKMVHNGIEYGIMQSLGEGFEVLEKAPYKFDLLKIARLYQKGTLVSGFMLDRLVEVIEKNPALADIEGIIAESGEARWTVEQAQEEGVETDIIKRSLEYRRQSQTDKRVQNSFTAKLVAALRNAFGGHDIQRK